MSRLKLVLGLALVVGLVWAVSAIGSASAAPLPSNCTKEMGTVTCTTTEGPGKNQGGVGTTTTDETKGNTTNKNPEPQDLQSDCTKKPPNAQGGPIGDCPA